MAEFDSLRLKIRPMISLSSPADARYAYYAFYHDPDRTELHVHEGARGRADGFAAVCQTAERLFQPTVALRTPDPAVAVELLRRALAPGRPYYLVTTLHLQEAAAEVVEMPEIDINRVYEIDLSRLSHEANVLVVAEEGIGGRPRFLIRSQEEIVAEAAVSWLSPHFGGVHAQVTPSARERGFGRAVVTACTRWVIRSGRHPLSVIEAEDDGAAYLLETVGYVDTGARELAGEVTCCR